MANIKSSKKFSIKSSKKRKLNISNKSMLRTFIKKVIFYINKKDKKTAIQSFINMQKVIDRQIIKGLIHKNRGARIKSKVFKNIKNLI